MGTKQLFVIFAGAFSLLVNYARAAEQNFTINFPVAGGGGTTIINTTFNSESGATLMGVIIVFTIAIVALLFYQVFIKKK